MTLTEATASAAAVSRQSVVLEIPRASSQGPDERFRRLSQAGRLLVALGLHQGCTLFRVPVDVEAHFVLVGCARLQKQITGVAAFIPAEDVVAGGDATLQAGRLAGRRARQVELGEYERDQWMAVL